MNDLEERLNRDTNRNEALENLRKQAFDVSHELYQKFGGVRASWSDVVDAYEAANVTEFGPWLDEAGLQLKKDKHKTEKYLGLWEAQADKIETTANAVIAKLRELQKKESDLVLKESELDMRLAVIETETALEEAGLTSVIATRSRARLNAVKGILIELKSLPKVTYGSDQWFVRGKQIADLEAKWDGGKKSIKFDKYNAPLHPETPEQILDDMLKELHAAQAAMQGKPAANDGMAVAEKYYRDAINQYSAKLYNKGDVIQNLIGLQNEIERARKESL